VGGDRTIGDLAFAPINDSSFLCSSPIPSRYGKHSRVKRADKN